MHEVESLGDSLSKATKNGPIEIELSYLKKN